MDNEEIDDLDVPWEAIMVERPTQLCTIFWDSLPSAFSCAICTYTYLRRQQYTPKVDCHDLI